MTQGHSTLDAGRVNQRVTTATTDRSRVAADGQPDWLVPRAEAGTHGWSARRRLNRRRRQIVDGLRAAARRSAPSAPARRFDVLLHERAAEVRPELLEVAALLDAVAEPPAELVDALHRLLTDGGRSPLYSREASPVELRALLDRACDELKAAQRAVRA